MTWVLFFGGGSLRRNISEAHASALGKVSERVYVSVSVCGEAANT
jgi:hypothetical protein